MLEDVSLKRIPNELKMNALWCGWKLTSKGKVPFNLSTGKFAKSNDPSTFVTYPVLLQHAHEYIAYDEEGAMIGGIGLGIFNGFSAIDIDHCVSDDGELSSLAKELIEFIDSYTEYSPSGRGIRIIFKTDVKIDKLKYYINNHKLGLEIYISNNTNKFVTITGNAISEINKGISECNIQRILDKYMLKGDPLDIALDKDDKLRMLWNSRASGSHGNESETDMALCCKLAFYLKGDFNAIDDAFQRSPYFGSKDEEHRAKWLERRDYRLMTINNAINMTASAVTQYTIEQNKGTKPKITYAPTDTGNAKRLVDKYGSIIRYNVENKRWMIYNGKHWVDDRNISIKRFAELIAEDAQYEAFKEDDIDKKKEKLKNAMRMFSSAGKEAMLKEAQHLLNIPVSNDDFDKNPYLLCCNNGVVDLRTGELQPHNPNFMCSMTTRHDVDFDKEPTLFLKFLDTTYSGDKELIDYVLGIFAYGLTGLTREQSMFQFYGNGRNGKSLLLELMSRMMGDYAMASKPALICEDRWGRSADPSEVASLKGKRMIFVEEPKQTDKIDESVVKNLTSGLGKIKACFKYANPFEFVFTGKIFVATNYELITRATDYGFWRRQHLIRHEHSITDEEDDRDLIVKLTAEIPQILGLLIKRCVRYLKEGYLVKPKKVIEWVEDYKTEMDVIAQWVERNCETGTGADFYTPSGELYENFVAFAKKNKEYEMTATLFGRNLSKKFKKKRMGSGIVYIGIRIRKEAEDLSKQIAYEETYIKEDDI